MFKDRIKITKFYFILAIVVLLSYSLVLNSTTLSVYLTVVLFSIVMLYFSQNNIKYNSMFLFLGKISFSFYLIHYGVIKLFENYNLFNINSYFAVFSIFIITILLSFLSFKYIENPFINIGKNLIKRKYAK